MGGIVNPENIGAVLKSYGDRRILLVSMIDDHVEPWRFDTAAEGWTPPKPASDYLQVFRALRVGFNVIPWTATWNPVPPGHLTLTMGTDSEVLSVGRSHRVTVDDDAGSRWRIRVSQRIAGVDCVLIGPWHDPDVLPDWSGRGFG